MGPDVRHTVATLTRLRRELSEDRQTMAARAAEIDEARPRLEERPWTSYAALAVHGWYTALEAGLERAARTLDGDVPRGDRWHRDLLSQVTVEVPGVRPAVISRRLLPELLELLAFRHFFRHAYAVSFDPARVGTELDRLERIAPRIDAGLAALDAHLEAAIESLRRHEG
jgi:hypothetical protein